MELHNITRFTYRLRHSGDDWYISMTIKYRHGANGTVLSSATCQNIWELRGEMPTAVADIIPEVLWDAHADKILQLIGQALGHEQTGEAISGELF